MAKRLQVWFEAGAKISGTDQFNLLRLKDSSGNIAYKHLKVEFAHFGAIYEHVSSKAEDKKSADIVVFGEGDALTDINPQKQKPVHPVWVSHCLLENEAVPVTKRYDASLVTPTAPKPAPVIRSHLIDSDSEDSSSSEQRVVHKELSDKKDKKKSAKDAVVEANVVTVKAEKSLTPTKGKEVEHKSKRRDELEDDIFEEEEGAGSEEESLESQELPKTKAPSSAHRVPVSKSAPAKTKSQNVPNRTAKTEPPPVKTTPKKSTKSEKPSAKSEKPSSKSETPSAKSENSSSKKRPAPRVSVDSDSEEVERMSPKKKKRKEAEEDDARSRAKNSAKKAKSTEKDDHTKSKETKSHQKQVEEDDGKLAVYICNCPNAEKLEWRKKVHSDAIKFVETAEDSTHLVLFLKDKAAVARLSLSTVAAIASGKWVVSTEWLKYIIDNDGALPENIEDFEMHEMVPSCRVSRLAHERRAAYLESKGITEDEVDDDDPDLPPLLFDGWTFNLDHVEQPFYSFIVRSILDCGGYIGNKVHADIWLVKGVTEVVEVLYRPRQGAPEEDEALRLEHPDWKKRKFINIHTKNSFPVFALHIKFFMDAVFAWEIPDPGNYANLYQCVQALGYGKNNRFV